MAELCAELDACLAELHGGETVVTRPVTAVRRRRRSSAWPVVVALLVVIAIGAVVGYLVLNHKNSPSATGSQPPPSTLANAVPLQGVTAYDPYGSPPGQEHNADAPKATDGDPNTYWETEQYHSTFAALGKPGVGLVLATQQPQQLRQLGIATATPGFHAVIKAGDAPGGPWTDVSTPQVVQQPAQISLDATRAYRYWLIWITQLPSGQPSVRINDVEATAG